MGPVPPDPPVVRGHHHRAREVLQVPRARRPGPATGDRWILQEQQRRGLGDQGRERHPAALPGGQLPDGPGGVRVAQQSEVRRRRVGWGRGRGPTASAGPPPGASPCASGTAVAVGRAARSASRPSRRTAPTSVGGMPAIRTTCSTVSVPGTPSAKRALRRREDRRGGTAGTTARGRPPARCTPRLQDAAPRGATPPPSPGGTGRRHRADVRWHRPPHRGPWRRTSPRSAAPGWSGDGFGLSAREQLTCGFHAHVAVGSREESVAVLDRIRIWLPVLLALSANSPVSNGADSGYASCRYQARGRWPPPARPRPPAPRRGAPGGRGDPRHGAGSAAPVAQPAVPASRAASSGRSATSRSGRAK